MIVKTRHAESKLNSGWKITLICMAYGSPRPWIRWYKDGKHLDLGINESVIGNHIIKSVLEIQTPYVSIVTDKKYRCIAGNNVDADSRMFTVESRT